MQIWAIVTPDNDMKMWLGTWRNRVFRRMPKVSKDGFVHLDEWPYVVDPQRFIRRKIKTRTGREKEFVYQFWRLNESDPVTFDEKMTPGSVGITAQTISQYAKSEHLRRLVQPEKDWVMWAIIALILGVAGGAIGYSLGLQQGLGR